MAKLRSNMIYQTVYNVLAVCVPLVTSPYLSRVLGAEGLGIYSYNYSIVSYFMLFALLGVTTYGMRTVSQSKDKTERSKNFFSIYAFQLISSFASLVVYLLFVIIFIKDDISRTVSYIHVLYLVAECININWFFFGLEKYKSIVIRNIIIKLITVASIFAFVRKSEDIAVYVFILAFCNVLSNLVIWLQLRPCIERVKITWADIKMHIKPNLLLFIPALAASVYHIMDKTMLGMFSDNANSGYYYNADKLLNIPLVVVTGCSSVFMTRTCTLYKDNDMENAKKTQNESVFFGMCVICAVAFGICAVAAEFVPWFFGAGYEPCITLVKYFAIIVICKTLSTHTRSVFLIPEKNDRSYANAILIGALINLVASYILIAYLKLGALGATLAILIAEFTVVITQIMMMKNKESKAFCIKGIGYSMLYVLAGAVMMLVVQIVPLNIASLTLKMLVKIAIGACVYVLECIILWRVKPSLMPDMIGETIQQIKNKLLKNKTKAS